MSDRRRERSDRVAQAQRLYAELRRTRGAEYQAGIVAEIADELNVTRSTVRQYLRHPDASPGAKPAGAARKRRSDRISDEEVIAAFWAWRERQGEWPNSTHWQPGVLRSRPGENSRRWIAAWNEGWVDGDGTRRRFPYANKVDFARLRAEAMRRWDTRP